MNNGYDNLSGYTDRCSISSTGLNINNGLIVGQTSTFNGNVTINNNNTGDYSSCGGIMGWGTAANTFTNLPSGEYTVYVNDKNGCGLSKKDIYLLMYPKYFTPNGDGYND